MKKIYLILFAALFSAASCVEVPELPSQNLELSMDAIVATPLGAQYTLKVSTNTKWRLQNDSKDWITVDVSTYTGSADVNVTVLPNTGEDRTAVLEIVSEDRTISRRIDVLQPSPVAKGFVPVSAVRSLYTGTDRKIVGNLAKIKGFVVSDSELGNWDSGFVIQDTFVEKNSGIVIASEASEFERGAEVAVSLDGATLRKDGNGRLVLEPSVAPFRTETTNFVADPVEISYADFMKGSYESMYVKIDAKVQLEQANFGSLWSSSPYFENQSGERFRLIVHENAAFGGNECPTLAGEVVGIAGPAAMAELYPVDVEDMEFTQRRFAINPGLTSLPYVFSFYCSENLNERPKYLEYERLQYDHQTRRIEGVVARDFDATIDASLSISAFGADVTKIASNDGAEAYTNYWAEPRGHDNINTSGFLLNPPKDGKQDPEGECGFYLDIPLKMNMPDDFNISFGIGANEWTLSNWAVCYYSEDKWIEAGDILIDHIVTGGSYYLYFTVPVHLETPIVSGTTMKIKFIPKDGYCVKYGNKEGTNKYDGHGSSCFVRLHSAIVISEEVKGNTPVPGADVVYFQPFDELTAGMDYFIGDKLAAFANYCADDIKKWESGKKLGKTGAGQLSGEFVRERPGYAQIGYVDTERAESKTKYVNNIGSLVLPSLGQSGELELSFKAAAYKTPAIRPGAERDIPDVKNPDLRTVVVEAVGGAVIDNNPVREETLEDGSTILVSRKSFYDLPADRFEDCFCTITGVTPDTRIRFTSKLETDEDGKEKAGFTRWFIDDICITKKK